MIVIFYGILLFLIFINYLTERKNYKVLSLIAFSMIVLMCIFVNDSYTDWSGYVKIFNRSAASIIYAKDVGFGFLCFILNKLGLGAIWLRVVIFGIGFSMIYQSCIKVSIDPLLTITFYSVYPLVSDSIQLRNFIVLAIVTYAIISLYKDGSVVKYIVFISVAFLFHKIAIFYLPICFIGKISKRKSSIKYIIGSTAVIVLLIGSNRAFIGNIISYLININDSFDLGNYKNFGMSTVSHGWIIDWGILIIVNLLIICLNYDLKKVKERNNIMIEPKLSLLEYVKWIDIYAIVFLPFTLISFDYFRLIRNLLLLNYMAYACYLESVKSKTKYKITVRKLLINITLIAFVIMLNYLKLWFRGEIVEREFLDFFMR